MAKQRRKARVSRKRLQGEGGGEQGKVKVENTERIKQHDPGAVFNACKSNKCFLSDVKQPVSLEDKSY